MNILFVCESNIARSPTAEHVLKGIVREKSIDDITITSAGLKAIEYYGGKQLDTEQANWADRIYVMEEEQRKEIINGYGQPEEKIKVLDIPDIYSPYDQALVDLLRKRLEEEF